MGSKKQELAGKIVKGEKDVFINLPTGLISENLFS